MTVADLLSSLLGLGAGLLALIDLAREIGAPRVVPSPPPRAGPLVSVVVPARNEGAHIDALLEGLLAQNYPHLEVQVVDDASEDDTAAKVQGWKTRYSKLTLLHAPPLPAGWVGKSWALAQGVAGASGSLLLFLDADVIPGPNLVSSLVHRLESRRLDALSCFPRLRLESAAEQLVLPAFHSVLYALYPLRGRAPFANGQCLLVRREVYEAAGGHEGVRHSVLEDVHLAVRLGEIGARMETAQAFSLLECRMYAGWPSLAEGLRKNVLAGFRSGGARSLWVGIRQTLLAFGPFPPLIATALALGAGRPPALLTFGALAALFALLIPVVLAARRFRASPWVGLLFSLGMAVYFGLSAQALWRIHRGGQLRWKGRGTPQPKSGLDR